MTKNLKKILISVCCLVLVFCAFLGVQKFVPTYAADSTLISMTGTASANLKSEERSGLRFAARIESNGFIALLNEYGEENVEAGMMTVPTDYLKDALDKGNDFTVAGIDAYGRLSGYTYYGISQNFVEVKDGETLTAYEFYMTVDGISLSNYNRDYSARAFIRVKAQELVEIDGVDNSEFSKEGDYYYSYAAYNKDTHETARNVYEVAYDAYIKDAVGDSQEIAKKFIDGVAVISGENGVASIANNTSGENQDYVAPYTLNKNLDGEYCFFDKAVIYNGERITAKKYYDKENDVTIVQGKSSGATFNNDGSVTLDGRYPTGGLGWNSGFNKTLDNSYIAFEGDYGVGTYMDFTFKGNNLPQVMLFANDINGNMSCGELVEGVGKYRGYIVTNGLYGNTANGMAVVNGDRVLCFGPYRMWDGASFNSYASSQVCSEISQFEQNFLATDTSGDEYKYTVGSYVENNVVKIEIRIKNVTTGSRIAETSWSTGKAEAEVEALGSNIIIYGCVKDTYTDGTTFNYSAPYQSQAEGVKASGAKFNKDGSVSLDSRFSTNGKGYNSGLSNTLDNSYVAFEGNYGVGTYVDFTFTGNNLPQVTLFADNINGNMTRGAASSSPAVNTGYLIMNGMYSQTSAGAAQTSLMSYLLCFGPNRQGTNNTNYNDIGTGSNTTSIERISALKVTESTVFGQTALKNNTHTLKYTVGSYYDTSDQTIVIEVSLYDVTENTTLGTGTYDTGKTADDMKTLNMGTNIIAYGCLKGGIVPTTFSYTAPRTGK